MRFVKLLSFAFLLLASTIVFTSAKPASKEPKVNVAAANAQAKIALADGKLTTSELNEIAVAAKGAKLSLKEKIALKVFGKKIANKTNAAPASGEKSQVIALILVALLGGLGIHRFYLGYTWQGVVQLLTLGGCGVWALIDLVRIIMGTLKPKDGEYDVTL